MELSPLYHNARPEGELLPQEAAAFALLEELGIDYDRVSSEPADTMEKCAAVSQALGVPICKNLFLCNRQKTQFYLLCMGPGIHGGIFKLPPLHLHQQFEAENGGRAGKAAAVHGT